MPRFEASYNAFWPCVPWPSRKLGPIRRLPAAPWRPVGAPITASMTPWPLPLHEPGCSAHVTPHRLRHSYATEMLRLGVSLRLSCNCWGTKTSGMTLRYLEVTSRICSASSIAHARTHPTACPAFSSRHTPTPPAFPPSSRHWRRPRHLLEMHRRCLSDEKAPAPVPTS